MSEEENEDKVMVTETEEATLKSSKTYINTEDTLPYIYPVIGSFTNFVREIITAEKGEGNIPATIQNGTVVLAMANITMVASQLVTAYEKMDGTPASTEAFTDTLDDLNTQLKLINEFGGKVLGVDTEEYSDSMLDKAFTALKEEHPEVADEIDELLNDIEQGTIVEMDAIQDRLNDIVKTLNTDEEEE